MNIKKFLIKHPPRKRLLILQGMEHSSSKIKKFLIFQEMKLPNSNTKKFIIFSQNKAVLIFQETETPKKNFLCFSKCNFHIFQETETLKTYLSRSDFPSLKNKKKTFLQKLLIFRETELSIPKLQRGLFITFFFRCFHLSPLFFGCFYC